MASFSVCTYNVHMFYDEAGRNTYEEMVKLLRDLNPDVLCLQEVISVNKLAGDLAKVDIAQPNACISLR